MRGAAAGSAAAAATNARVPSFGRLVAMIVCRKNRRESFFKTFLRGGRGRDRGQLALCTDLKPLNLAERHVAGMRRCSCCFASSSSMVC